MSFVPLAFIAVWAALVYFIGVVLVYVQLRFVWGLAGAQGRRAQRVLWALISASWPVWAIPASLVSGALELWLKWQNRHWPAH